MAGLAWLTIALPLVGAVVNGWLAFRRPDAKDAVSWIGTGVMVAAFAVAIAAFLDVRHAHDGVKLLLWDWMPVSDRLHIELALMVDRL